jgi:putative chitinase
MTLEFLTQDKLKELLPSKNDKVEEWYEAMTEYFPKFEIDTPLRVAAFIAQCGHESNGFTVLKENLNYSADALNKVFPKYFKNAGREAEDYHRQPEKIANVIYANRMGNGDTESGDGWFYRGRGPIQLTGKDNYTNFANDFFDDPETVMDDPDLLCDHIPTALLAAIWFWNKNGLNKYADEKDIRTMTRKINGGYIGLEDREKHYNHALEILDA